ncbi:MAG TPA: DUF1554 domain-containing protein [Gammaproteobacteria bacterium]|jgi:hypothetical protein|nr:DUF1554 domain-containing protein [Gammaproteobacteria bacterium]
MIDKKILAAGVAVLALGTYTALAQKPAANMSFFVTSSNPKGGNLGGLAGADVVCQSLAQAAGAGAKTWHAYLSTSTVDAKTRIGKGPWYNFKGDLIAQNVADLHTPDKNKISGKASLTEKGTTPNYLSTNDKGEVQRPTGDLQHDILTGTNEDGTKNADTCKDWTVGDDSAKAMLGHADRLGRNAGLNSWNAIHPSQGCGMDQLKPTGGAGLLYCFATN